MGSRSVIITSCELVTAFGGGLTTCWRGLMEGRSAASVVSTFDTSNFISDLACLVPDLAPAADGTRVSALLDRISGGIPADLPEKTELFLATTVGGIETLERAVEEGGAALGRYSMPWVLEECGKRLLK